MFPSMSHLCIYLIIMLVNVEAIDDVQESRLSRFRIGVTVDYTSRVGKEQMTAVRMAIDDYYNYTTNKPSLHMKHSGQDPASTVFSVIDLINKTQVNAILGLSMQNKLEFIAEICSKAKVPMLSLEDAPVWVSKRWPFLIPATHKNYEQMRAVAAIIGTWQWRTVNVIYEDVVSARLSIFPHLVDALNKVGARVENFLALTLTDSAVSEKLLSLVHEQSRVFIVHTSLPLANLLFQEAKKLGLLEKDSVWIITNTISDLLDVVDSSLFTTMQGSVGVKSHYPKKGTRIEFFMSRFRHRFHLDYPDEQYLDPSIYALQAYDAVWAVAHARERTNVDDSSEHLTPLYGKTLLNNIYRAHFVGLTGEFEYINGELAPLPRFKVINVLRNRYKELGSWSVNFSEGVNMSMGILRKVLWPGGTLSAPRGWSLPTSESPLLLGVPYHPSSHPFACVIYNPGREPTFNGLSSEVFKAVAQNLPYPLEFKIIPFNDSYDDLVKQIYNKDGVRSVDAVVGDIAILSSRSKYAEFSLPWAESGLQMVVLRKSLTINTAWLFKKPYTNGMWGLTAGITVYNGLVVWLMERTNHQELSGSSWNKFGALIWLAFSTFFSLEGERLQNNLSRVTILVWLFVSIIIIQSYTAKLTSILTLPNFQHKYITLDSLKRENAKVGCDRGSFVSNYLETVLGVKPRNIVPFSSYDDYIQALQNKEIKAAFLEVPYVKFLSKKYCNRLEIVGETFNVGGFGFVFPIGSPMLPDINQAILDLKESGVLGDLEAALVKSYKCSDPDTDEDEHHRLDVTSFWGLFVITATTSTIAFILHLLLNKGPKSSSIQTAESTRSKDYENRNIHGTQSGQDTPGTVELVEHGRNDTRLDVHNEQDPSLHEMENEGEHVYSGEQTGHGQEMKNEGEQADSGEQFGHGQEIANEAEQTYSGEQTDCNQEMENADAQRDSGDQIDHGPRLANVGEQIHVWDQTDHVQV